MTGMAYNSETVKAYEVAYENLLNPSLNYLNYVIPFDGAFIMYFTNPSG